MSSRRWIRGLCAVIVVTSNSWVYADPDKDESGHGRGKHHAREHKEEFWDGNCKVERKWEKDGGYKEERKCEGRDKHGHRHGHAVVVQPAPVVAYPPWIVVQQGQPVYREGHEPAPVQQPSASRCNSDTVGQILGGVVGAAVGNQIGKGSGRAVATVGGTVVGVLIGGEIGRRMDADDQACVGQALEVAPAGHRVQWNDGSQSYAVVPGKVERRNGRYCRRYDAEVMTPSGPRRVPGTACRQPDGSWVAVR